MTIELLDMKEQFTQQEACDLLNSHVVRKEHEHNKNIEICNIGYVAGVITLNDEIEVMVKFSKELLQLNKFKFQRDISLIEMP